MRPDKDEYYLIIAKAVSLRGTCARRKVGCVLVDQDDRIMATGYNGVARGQVHCTDQPCPGATAAPGTGLDLCEAIHAETNAIAYCRDIYKIKTCYVTASPCVSCVKMLLGTSCKLVVFLERYAHDEAAQRLFLSGDGHRGWVHRPSVLASYIGAEDTLKVTGLLGGGPARG